MASVKRIRYYDAESGKKPEPEARTLHSDFLRHGHITRYDDQWMARNRRYLSYEQVAAMTGRRLEEAGKITHRRLNNVHRGIRFPAMVRHQILEEAPHLGYCHVTAAKTEFRSDRQVTWSFYLANFFSEIGTEDSNFFSRISPGYSRMYFAVTTENTAAGKKTSVDRKSLRPDGLLFVTHDPGVAMKNMLMLGARSPELRRAIASL